MKTSIKKMTKENDQKRNVIKLEGGLGQIEIWAVHLFFLTLDSLSLQNRVQYVCIFFTYPQTSQTRHLTFVWEIPFTGPKYTEGLVRL